MKVYASLVASILFLLPLVTPTEALAVIQSLDGLTVQNQSFVDDSNVTLTPSGSTHTLGWFGHLPVSRGGTGAGSFTLGSLLFSTGTSISQDNSNLFWDDTNNRLGIGTSSPTSTLSVSGNTSISGDLNVTGNITGNITATNLVPYTGATGNVDLGTHNITAAKVTSTGDATINTLTIGLGGGSVSSNTALGKDALLNAASSNYNLTAIGENALKNPVANTGDSTAVGRFALWSGGGDQNTAIGSGSMYNTTIGQYNTALGFSALRENTTGIKNTVIGWEVLYKNTSGSNNIAIGGRTAFFQADGSTNLTSPENSIYIGHQARGYDDNDDNSIVIGTSAIGAGANKTVIGNSSMTDVYFGSSSANANTHAKKMFLGSSTTPRMHNYR